MVLVRMVFQVKSGHAAEMAAGMKQGHENGSPFANGPRHVRILTDLSGPFDTVVQELEFDCLEDFVNGQAALFADERIRQQMEESRPLIVSGSKEYYTIEYTR